MKRVFTIFPILLTALFNGNLKAENYPLPVIVSISNFIAATESHTAIPIFANTYTAYNDIREYRVAVEKNYDEPIDASLRVEMAVRGTMEMERLENETEASIKKVFNVKASSDITKEYAAKASMEDRRQFIAWFAEQHVDAGFRYRYGGNNVATGIDCSGFTRYVLGYFDFKTGRSSRDQAKEGQEIPLEKAKPGDLVFFGKKYIDHVAMVVKNDDSGLWVVHSTYRGIVKDNVLQDKYWKNKLRSTAVSIIGE